MLDEIVNAIKIETIKPNYDNLAAPISYVVRVNNFVIMKTIRLGIRDGNNQKARPLLVELDNSNVKYGNENITNCRNNALS